MYKMFDKTLVWKRHGIFVLFIFVGDGGYPDESSAHFSSIRLLDLIP